MSYIKKYVYISRKLLKEVNAINPNFDVIVAEALKDYIHRCKIQKALKSFGKWTGRTESSVDIVNNLRYPAMPGC